MRNLILERKIVIFKTIAIQKIASQLFMTAAPKHTINELEKYRRSFCGKILFLK